MSISGVDYLKKVDEYPDGVGYCVILNFATPPLTRNEAIMGALRLDGQGYVTLEWSRHPELGNIPRVRITEEGKLALLKVSNSLFPAQQ